MIAPQLDSFGMAGDWRTSFFFELLVGLTGTDGVHGSIIGTLEIGKRGPMGSQPHASWMWTDARTAMNSMRWPSHLTLARCLTGMKSFHSVARNVEDEGVGFGFWVYF